MGVRNVGALLMGRLGDSGGCAAAVAPEGLPFAVCERLTYRARVTRMGATGHGAMWIEGPVMVRGRSVYVLRFEFRAGLGPVKAVDRTESWLDPLLVARGTDVVARANTRGVTHRPWSVQPYENGTFLFEASVPLADIRRRNATLSA